MRYQSLLFRLVFGFCILWLGLFFLVLAVHADRDPSLRRDTTKTGGTCTPAYVDVSSSSEGVLIISGIPGYAAQISITSTSPASGVWIMKTSATCATALTQGQGYYLPAIYGAGYDFIPSVEGWTGPLCGILAAGSTTVTVSVCQQN